MEGNSTIPGSRVSEQQIIGACLRSDEILWECQGTLSPDHFLIPLHARIYQKILSISDTTKPTIETIVTYFEDDEDFHGCGGLPFLAGMVANAPPNALAIEARNEVVRLWQLRKLMELSRGIQEEVQTWEGGDPENILSQAAMAFEEVSHKISPRSEVSVGALMGPLMERLLDEDKAVGVKTGIGPLDRRIPTGFQDDNLIIIAGRPGMGKTTVGFNMAYQMSQQSVLINDVKMRRGVLWLSLEMSKEENAARAASMMVANRYESEHRVKYQNIMAGRLDPEQIARIYDATDGPHTETLVIDDAGRRTLGSIRAQIQRVRSEMYRKGIYLSAVFIDQLSQIAPDSKYKSIIERFTDLSGRSKALAKQLRIPIFLLHQLSRAVESRENKRPTMADLRETGSLEQDADLVILVYRGEYYAAKAYQQDSSNNDAFVTLQNCKNKMELNIDKYRMGEPSVVTLYCDVASNYVTGLGERI